MGGDRVSESAPVQVYLDGQSRLRLERLAENLSTTKSEVLRRGLLALERETTDPAAHPVLQLVGVAIANDTDVTYDVAREHDRFLAGVSEPGVGSPKTSRKRPRRG